MHADLLQLWAYEHYRPVQKMVMMMGASLEQAEDAVQDAFKAAWDELNAGRTIRNPPGWLRTVALNCYRRPPGRKRPPDRDRRIIETSVGEFTEEQLRIADDPIDLSTQAMFVGEVLKELPEGDRILIVLAMDGFSWAEIARMLGRDDQEVRDRAKKIRRTLKGRFAHLHMDDRGGRSK